MKQLIKNYTFNASAKTVTLADFTANGLLLERLQLIIDTTTNAVLYNFADNSVTTASIGGGGNTVITLSSVGSAASSDKLMVIYDCQVGDPVYDAPVIQGNVASGSTDSGNPVKAGGVYNSSAPTPSSGQRVDLQVDAAGRLIVNPAPLTATADSVTASLNPAGGGGWTPVSFTALTNTVVSVKSGAGQLGGYAMYNPNASVEYIQVFNLATSSVTLGTTAPTYVLPIPAGALANIEFANGIAHATAISVAATTAPTGSSAPGTALVGTMLRA